MAVWWLTHETTHTADDHVARLGRDLERRVSSFGQVRRRPTTRQAMQKALRWLQSLTLRDLTLNTIIRPLEVANTGWLTYTGYIDFETYQYYAAHGVYLTWGLATGLSLLVLSLGLAYIVFEYCTQAHLSTENYTRALRGLKHTRWFKKHTLFIRLLPDVLITWGKLAWHKLRGGKSRRGRRSLVWTATCKKDPPVIDARNGELGMHMQGTEAQWKDVFFGNGKHRSKHNGGLTSSLRRNPDAPSMRQDGADDLEKG
ncbi:MAG: hypothetical protein Q9200_001618 [Gallowayella weberi]